ncbi:MAG: nucleoside deaminase [Phycisphaeraceae bacterium]
MSEPSAIDITMMQRALEQARAAAAMGEVPIGAVVYRGEEVLAEAHNLRESQRDPTAHAEILALRIAARKLASWRMDDCSIAVTLEPCPMCAGALVNARMPRLVYGAPDAKMGCVHTLYELCTDERFNHRLEVIAGVEADESVRLLQEFFAARRGKERPAKPSAE